MVTASALMASLYFGGWTFPGLAGAPYTGLKTILTLGIFLAKVLFFLFTFMWIRWTLPRFRYDQLMSLGWKVMLPLALSYIVVISGVMLAFDRLGLPRGPIYGVAMFAVNIVLLVILFLIIDRGRIISPAYRPLRAAELARLRAVAGPAASRPVEV